MNATDKQVLKSHMMLVTGMLSSAKSMTNMPTMTPTGPIASPPAMTVLCSAVEQLVKLVEEVIDKA